MPRVPPFGGLPATGVWRGVLWPSEILMGSRICRNFRRLFAVRLAVVTNRVRVLVWFAGTILLRLVVVVDR